MNAEISQPTSIGFIFLRRLAPKNQSLIIFACYVSFVLWMCFSLNIRLKLGLCVMTKVFNRFVVKQFDIICRSLKVTGAVGNPRDKSQKSNCEFPDCFC